MKLAACATAPVVSRLWSNHRKTISAAFIIAAATFALAVAGCGGSLGAKTTPAPSPTPSPAPSPSPTPPPPTPTPVPSSVNIPTWHMNKERTGGAKKQNNHTPAHPTTHTTPHLF